MKEARFQKLLINELKSKYPGAEVLKISQNGTGHQGFPDLLFLYKDKWAALEVKQSKTAHRQPNQARRVAKLNDMSFARFIYPENKTEVLNELERSLSGYT